MLPRLNHVTGFKPALYRYFLAYLVLLLVPHGGHTQSREGIPLEVLPPELVTCTPAGSFVSRVLLHNLTSDTVRFVQRSFASDYFIQLGDQGRQLQVAPGDTIRVSLRFLNRYGRINGRYQLPVVFVPEGGSPLSLNLPVQLVQGMEPRVFAEVMQDKVWVLPGMQQLSVPVKMRSFLPSGTPVVLEMAEPHPTLQLLQPRVVVRLPQLHDTIVQLALVRLPTKTDMVTADKPLAVRVSTMEGRMLTSFSFLPYILATARTMFTTPGAMEELKVATAMGIRQGGGMQQELSLAYKLAQPLGALSGQLNYTRFGDANLNQLNASWLQYRNKTQAILVGSISDFHELNLQGRGVRLSQAVPGKNLHADVWVMDNNTNLLAPFTGASDQTVSTQLTYGGFKGGDVVVSSNWFQRGNTFSHGSLQFAEWRPRPDKEEFLTVRLGTSVEQYAKLDTTLRGVSALVDGGLKTKWINWRGRYSYASPAYAGNQRGLVSGTVQATVNTLQRYSLNFRYNLFAHKVAAQLWKVFPQLPMQMQTLEMDASWRLGQSTLSFKPYYLKQKQQFPLLLGGGGLSSQAMNLSVLLNQRIGKIGLGLNWDGGLQQKMPPGKPVTTSLAWRAAANLSWNKISLAAFMQQGGYFLAEQQAALSTGNTFRNFTATGGYGTAIGKNWFVQSAASGSYISLFSQWQYSLLQDLRYAKGPWQTAASLMYFGNRSGMFQARIGVQRSIALHPERRHLLQVAVRVFEDQNSDGVHDTGEPYTANQLVRVDGMLMITNSEGAIRLSGLTKGVHRFEVLAKGLSNSLLLTRQFDLQTKATLSLGIPPLYPVAGTVLSSKDRFTGRAETVGNIRITLSGPFGEQVTFTNAKGAFSFIVPAGQHKVYITQLHNTNHPGTSAMVNVDPQQGFTGKLELIWTAGERPVQVKKSKYSRVYSTITICGIQ
ncbi:hypothetical protein SAMN05444008_12354 [Cnuella takakiae]|uniref:Uncharacterized protein n=1 Tax=Cnuella takakiae TaxID=1302690 RepID=A0A1M5IEK9_9BACT|nr:hypothetical protein [Cnuella takakiae]OLY90820.1 hypothetical protein BUE76_02085 [Cnuella takakiae]SHG26705.1 hypothetical protein SAMN05444008_12354 [Cnuella takakiae]